MVLASRAIPDDRSPLATPLQGFHATGEIADDLTMAFTFNTRTATAIEFTVPDRDNNGSDELIRYEWTGTPGDPLMRTYNAGTSTEVASDVYEFNLKYWTATRSDKTTSATSTTGAETVLASFESWPGIVAIAQDYIVGTSSWVSEYFQVVPPAGATELIFTQARVTMRRDNLFPPGSPMVSVGIHPAGTGTEPAAAPIGTPTNVVWTDLPTSYLWHTIPFAGVSATNLATTDYCLVLKGTDAASAYVRELWNKSAPDNGVVENWTSNAGGSWSPASNKRNKQDIRFYVYGQWVTTTPVGTPYDRKFVQGVEVTVLVGPDVSARATTAVDLINTPEVPIP